MQKRVRRFLKEYKHFSITVLAIISGLILTVAGQAEAAKWLLTAVAAVSAIPLLRDIIVTLRTGSFGVDVLALTAIVTAAVLGEYWAAIIIVLMLTGGEALEDYAEKRAKKELTSLLSNRPKKAHLLKGRKVVDVKASSIQPGDKLSILPGEVIPVDAVVLEGDTSLNEASITGESLPVTKTVGDEILSGSINIEGAITVKALHSAADSQYEQIIKLVRAATASQAPFVRLADRYSVPFTALSFFIAGAAWFISGDVDRFLEVLVVATPCPLILGAPIAIISGMSRGSKQGIIIKNGSALEQLADVQTVAFDKTGTLTTGNPVVKSVKAFNGFTKEEILRDAASLEQSSTHILAAAVVAEAESQKISFKAAKQVSEESGRGLKGRVGGHTILVGRATLLEDNNVEIALKVKDDVSRTATFVAVGGKLAGVISFEDSIRPEASGMLSRLRAVGIKRFALITGDNEASALKVAKELDIADIYPECLPSEKMRAIEDLPAPVAFVGDGVNDAPVLTTANVGIALGARGSTAASETADVVIMKDNVAHVASSIEIAKRTMFIAKQSVMIGILISIGLMLLFATGRFSAVQGALVQELVDIIVIVNALRAHSAGQKFKRLQAIQ